jgi:hypothetical protein
MVVDEVDLVARENIDRISFGDILNNIYKAWN